MSDLDNILDSVMDHEREAAVVLVAALQNKESWDLFLADLKKIAKEKGPEALRIAWPFIQAALIAAL